MLLTTTNTIEGKEITQYFGIVSGETIIGANVFKISSQASGILSEDVQVLTRVSYAKRKKRP